MGADGEDVLMAHSRHGVDTVLLHTLATGSIELSVGGGLGCPEEAARANGVSGAS